MDQQIFIKHRNTDTERQVSLEAVYLI